MKQLSKKVLGLVVAALLVLLYLWVSQNAADTFISPNVEIALPTPVQDITRQPSASDRQVYINQDWRFSFELPIGWYKMDDGYVTNFNTTLDVGFNPVGEEGIPPIRIATITKIHSDQLIEREKEDEDKYEIVTIGGLETFSYQSITKSVVKKTVYLIEIDQEQTLYIGIENEYLPELQVVLDTFQFHEPIPTLAELEERGVVEVKNE